MSPRIRDLFPAIDRREEILGRLSGKRVAVFLDYDGTLVPIMGRPDLAVLADATRRVISRLAEIYTVGIISGRDRSEVERLVGLQDLVYAGGHGFDIAIPDGRTLKKEIDPGSRDLLDRIRGRLRKELGNIQGVILEPKPASLAVHYRLTASIHLTGVKAVIDGVLSDYPELRMTPGKKVYDLQPRIDWDKGKAVCWILEAMGLDRPDCLALYVGDDITDEDAFRVLGDRGIGIFVGAPDGEENDRRTGAHYGLNDTDEVRDFLDALIPS